MPQNFSSAEISELYITGKNENYGNATTNIAAEATAAAPFPLDIISQDPITSVFIESLQQSLKMSLRNTLSENSTSKKNVPYEKSIAYSFQFGGSKNRALAAHRETSDA